MRRTHAIVLFLLLAAVAAIAFTLGPGKTPVVQTPVLGCGKSDAVKITKVPLTSFDIKTPLYAIISDRKLVKIDLHSHQRTLISEHEFSESEPTMVLSADGRWISYSGEVRENTATEYWLYDKRNGTDRLMLQHPAWGGGIPVFSPDGTIIAIAANYDSRWENDAKAGIYLIDTETLRSSRIDIPIQILTKDAMASIAWSEDGKELLIAVSGYHFAYDMANKRIEKISGRYDREIRDEVFSRQGAEIHRFPEVHSRSSIGLRSETSPSGLRNAYLGKSNADSTYALEIAAKDGSIKKVAIGHYSNCEGETLMVTGWIDDRHLIYRVEPIDYFIFDTETGGTAALFDKKEFVPFFTW